MIDEIDCDGQIVAQNGTVLTNATNYYGQYCTSGPDANRGVMLDWVRLFWKLRTTQGFTRLNFQTMVDNANPDTWVFADPTGLPTADKPYERLKAFSPDPMLFGNQAATHGVDR